MTGPAKPTQDAEVVSLHNRITKYSNEGLCAPTAHSRTGMENQAEKMNQVLIIPRQAADALIQKPL